MADRAKKVSKNHQQASQKSSLSGKAEAKNRARHVNIVHRTTTESLRLESAAAVGGGAGDGSSSLDSVPPPAGTSSVSMLNAAAAAARKPKTSSFQITSVITKGGPPVSRISSASGGGGGADNGDDSADDLDESHAEDSSRVTDTETPSFSEDTFSKEDVFFTTSDAIGSAPVIPTSSQYGLAIVAPAMPGAQNLADVHVSVTDAGINLMTNSKKDVDLKDIHHRNERFKVVKIESTEPFRRGRWICMDYLDHSMVQPTIEEGGEGAAEGIGATTTEGEQQTGDSGAEGIEEGVVEEAVQSTESPGQTLQQPILANEIINNSSSSSTNNGNSSSNSSSSRNQTSTSHAQTIAHIPVSPQQQQQQTGGVPSSTPAMQFPDSNMVHGATLPTALQSTTTPAQQNTQTAPLLPQQLSVSVDQTPMPPQPESMSTFSPQQQVSVPSSAAPSPNPAQQIDSPQAPGAIPNGPIDSPAAVSEDSSITVISAAPAIPAPSDASATSPTAVEMAESAAEPGGATPAVGMGGEASSTNNNATSASASVSAATMASLMSPSTIAAAVAGTVNSSSSNSQGQTILPQSQQQLLQNIVSEDGASTEDSESSPTRRITAPRSRLGQRFLTQPIAFTPPDPSKCTSPSCSSNSSSSNRSATNIYTNIALGNCIENLMQNKPQGGGGVSQHKSVQNLIREERCSGGCGVPIPPKKPQYKGSVEDLRTISGSGRCTSPSFSSSMPNSPPRHLGSPHHGGGTGLSSRAASPLPHVAAPGGCSSAENSASGTSAVAIDNKIEQAMDLVKSHLMFAVREEVEVLKERIAELMDRINQLEVENTILKANATQETLSQLTTTSPPKVPPTNPANGPVS